MYSYPKEGPLAKDIKAHSFTNANVIGVREGTPNVARYEAAAPGGALKTRGFAVPASAAAPGGGETPEFRFDVIHNRMTERPQFRMQRNYAFDFQMVTENYVRF